MKLYIATNPMDAHILCSYLQVENIECEVRGESLFGLQGELPCSDDTDPYIWLLNPYQIKRAQTLLAEYHNQESSKTQWQCDSCKEKNEGQFELCWNCSEPRHANEF